jgi:tetratricopeptide (TPR) repeat protein
VGAELLGRGLALQNAFAEAREVVTSALAGLTDATPGERESKVNLTMVLAGIDQDEGRLDAAARNLERAIALCEGDPALRDPSMLASLEGSRAYVEAERGHAEQAVLAARLALKYLDEIGVSVEEKAEFQQLIDAGGVVVAE